eukprot:4242554-Ditylum_brightwellii.AAC.1
MKEMLQVNCFADADFVRLFSVENLQDVTLARSRTEYVTLSQSLRDLLPTKDLNTEVAKGMWQKDQHKEFKFVSKFTVYEENNGAIMVASCPKMTPTSK